MLHTLCYVRDANKSKKELLLSSNCQPRLAPYEDFLLFTLMSSSFAAVITTKTATRGGPIDVSDPLTVR